MLLLKERRSRRFCPFSITGFPDLTTTFAERLTRKALLTIIYYQQHQFFSS